MMKLILADIQTVSAKTHVSDRAGYGTRTTIHMSLYTESGESDQLHLSFCDNSDVLTNAAEMFSEISHDLIMRAHILNQ